MLIAAMLWVVADSVPTEARTPKEVLVITAAALPVTLDMDFGGSLESWEVLPNCCDPLTDLAVKTNQEGNREVDTATPPICLLCESYSRSSDGMKFTVKLRKGIKSFLGNELTSEDVRWSYERSVQLKGNGLFVFGFTSTRLKEPITVRDRYTFDIHLEGPNPLLPLVLAVPMPWVPILDSTEIKKHATANDPWAKEWLATHTAAFGAFHVESIIAGQEVVWVANPNYHGSAPKIRKVIYKQVPDSATRGALLQRGEVDIATELSPRQRAELSQKPGVVIESRVGNEAVLFGMNTKVPPFDNARVRQAITYALPMDDIIKTVFLNQPAVKVAPGFMPSYYPGALSKWPYQRDLAKARRLLREAGVQPFTMKLAFNSARPTHEEVATVMKTGLKEIGVEVVLDKLSPAKYQEQFMTRKADAVLVQDSAWTPDGPYALSIYFHGGGRGSSNWINYNNPTVTRLLDEGMNHQDSRERAKLARQAHEIIVSEAPWGFYLHIGYYVPRRDNVKGFIWRTNNLLRFRDFHKE
jgi:peptide/nickel transport system substrate-binding protein